MVHVCVCSISSFLIGFLAGSLDMNKLFLNYNGLKWTFPVLCINYLQHFIREFILSDRYKTYSPYNVISSSLVHLLPLCMVLLFVIAPYAKILGEGILNQTILVSVIVVRCFVEVKILQYQTNRAKTTDTSDAERMTLGIKKKFW